jgi:hypothetical protein
VAGKQRYRCLAWGASRSSERPDVSRRSELEAFLGWLMGTSSQSSFTSFGTARSLRRRTAWCWNIAPRIPVTGEVHDQIQVDGIYVGSWCCLIAVAGDYVLGWQWCDTEKKAAWAALLERFPAPRVVITDGGSGIAAALSECWSETSVQRCLVRVQRNVRTYLTGRPRTDAGKALLRLGRALTRIKAPADAAAWLAGFHDWHQQHGHLVKARTYRSTTAMVRAGCGPTSPGGTRMTGSARPTGSWSASAKPERCSRIWKPNTPGWTSPRRPTGSKAARTPSSGSCCGRTGARARNTRSVPSSGTSTCTASNPDRQQSSSKTATTDQPRSKPAPRQNGTPAPSSTAPDSALKKASGTAPDGQDAHDTPGNYTRFVL